MKSLEFRFYYFTSRYEKTVAFYRDTLLFEVYRTWNRGEEDRGTIFRSPNGEGFIEIEFGEDSPSIRGGFYIEVTNVTDWYNKVRLKGAPIKKELSSTDYGHRNFKTVDANGIEVSFFEYLNQSSQI